MRPVGFLTTGGGAAGGLADGGTEELLRRMDDMAADRSEASGENTWKPMTAGELRAAQREADRIIAAAVGTPARPDTVSGRVDAVLLHPVAGLFILLAVINDTVVSRQPRSGATRLAPAAPATGSDREGQPA